MPLDHRRLIVYRVALKLLAVVSMLVRMIAIRARAGARARAR
jgi:hypothetical protein